MKRMNFTEEEVSDGYETLKEVLGTITDGDIEGSL